MIWVLVFAGIALLGLFGLIAYAVWLWHKAEDVLSEVEMVGRQAEEILGLLDDIALHEQGGHATDPARVSVGGEEHVPSHQADLEFEPDFGRGALLPVRHRTPLN